MRSEIEAQLRQCPHVKFERDGFGNVMAHYRRGRRPAADWAFAAHMDQLGWVRGKDGEMQFLGSVAEQFRKNPRTKSFGDFAMWEGGRSAESVAEKAGEECAELSGVLSTGCLTM